MIKAVIFDLDDTLVKLNVDWGAANQAAIDYLAENGISSDGDIIESMLLAKGELRMEVSRVIDKYEEEAWDSSRLMPNAKECLEELSKSYELGVVTGNGRTAANTVLKNLDIVNYFKTVKTREDGLKPTAEPITKALEALGCRPKEAVYVGNSFGDMQAARAAGTKAIGYTSKYTAEQLKDAGADIIINDLREVKSVI